MVVLESISSIVLPNLGFCWLVFIEEIQIIDNFPQSIHSNCASMRVTYPLNAFQCFQDHLSVILSNSKVEVEISNGQIAIVTQGRGTSEEC